MKNLKINILFISCFLSLLLSQSFISANSKITPKQREMLMQAKVLESSGLIEQASIGYKNILIQFPYLKEAYHPLKKIYINNQNWDLLTEISNEYLDANQYSINSKLDVIEVYIITESIESGKIINEIFASKPINLNNMKKIISTLIKNKKEDYAINLIQNIRDDIKKQSFYSLELGMFYSFNLKYENAIDEYLIYIMERPKNIKIITQRIMHIADNKNSIDIIKNKLSNSQLKEAQLILSKLEFKLKNYTQAYEIIKDIDDERYKLDLVRDFIKIENYDLSQNIINDILDSSKNKKIINSAIFQLALLYEKKITDKTNNFPISYQIFKNQILDSPFTKLNSEYSNLLFKAVNIYDSLSTYNKDYKSSYHLADIKYKIKGDLDGAMIIYQNIYNNYSSRDYKKQALNNMINISLSKGDLSQTINKIDSLYKTKISIELADILNLKKIQFYFYSMNKDSLTNQCNSILKNLSKTDYLYNDILKIMSLFYTYTNEDLIKYIEAKFKIFQNKRTQAIEILNTIDKNNRLYSLAILESSYLETLQKNFSLAINNLNSHDNSNSIYNEQILILKGEIYDYGLNNISKAVDTYLEFLDLYPNSIHYDFVRLRLRKLASL